MVVLIHSVNLVTSAYSYNELFRKFEIVILIQVELGDGHGDSLLEHALIVKFVLSGVLAGCLLEHALRHCRSRAALPVKNVTISKFPITEVVFIVVITLPLHDERFVVEVVILTRREIDLRESHLAQISLFDDDGNHNVGVVTSVPLTWAA